MVVCQLDRCDPRCRRYREGPDPAVRAVRCRDAGGKLQRTVHRGEENVACSKAGEPPIEVVELNLATETLHG